jgi:peptide/nickel transport system substrate-binding protein
MRRRHRRNASAGTAVLAAVVMLAAGCAAGDASQQPAGAIRGGTATLAYVAGTGPDWIFPFANASVYNQANYQDFMDLMYRPLYMFGSNTTTGADVLVNYPLSPALPPVYADGGRQVTISLRGWKWSDRERVDAADVIFWLNLDEAEKADFFGYTPGTLPDNVASYRATGPDQVTLQLRQPVSGTWFTYNQLAEITPFPLAWDVTSLHGRPGSGGCATDTAADQWARCKAVAKFLTGQALARASYASSPLWSVVDGPWRLAAFVLNGGYAFTPNLRYSGSPKPALARLTVKRYPSDQAIYQALRAGRLSATVLASDVPPGLVTAPQLAAGPGYRLQPGYVFGINDVILNFGNPVYGPVFRQLYFRQALQQLTSQEAVSKAEYAGYAEPTVAGIPSQPASIWEPASVGAGHGAGPYPYDPAAARATLAAHGWRRVRSILTCEAPGTAPGDCGAGIRRGLQVRLTLLGGDGPLEPWSLKAVLAPELAAAGIVLRQISQGGLLGTDVPCSGRQCYWMLQYLGGWNFSGPAYEPTGEQLFQTGSPDNTGRYSNARMDALIKQTLTSGSLSAFRAYAAYTATQLPVLYLPVPYNLAGVSDRLHGVTQSPLGTFLPEYWYLAR